MGQRSGGQVSVIAQSGAMRHTLARLAGRLGLTADATAGREHGSGGGAAAVLFHTPPSSRRALAELRDVVRRSFPSPVIVLTTGPDEELRREAREAGAVEVLQLAQDETRTEAALAGVLARLHGSSQAPCPRCPLTGIGDGGPICLMKGLDQTTLGQDGSPPEAGHWRCFPFLATSSSMLRVERMARKAAVAGATVLITGESGAGKEVLARYVHWTGGRSRGPFVKVNCAALPEHLLESELFGYEKGAFTGAEARKPGRFELARRGVILLDEIADMGLGLQAKILHVLQDGRFTPLGGVRELDVDVQILATTNKDLDREVADGRFRKDLYYRLRVIELPVPPLREHAEDIPLLAKYFMCRFATQYGHCAPELGSAAIERLSRAPWPGNVRELENFMRRLVILGEDPTPSLGPAAPTPGLHELPWSSGDSPADSQPAPPPTHEALTLREAANRAARAAEREAIRLALDRTRWNRMQAARMLGVSYKTLLTKMKSLSM